MTTDQFDGPLVRASRMLAEARAMMLDDALEAMIGNPDGGGVLVTDLPDGTWSVAQSTTVPYGEVYVERSRMTAEPKPAVAHLITCGMAGTFDEVDFDNDLCVDCQGLVVVPGEIADDLLMGRLTGPVCCHCIVRRGA